MPRLLAICLLLSSIARADLTAPAAQTPVESCAEELRKAAQTLVDTQVRFAELGVLRLTDEGGVEYKLSIHGRCDGDFYIASFLPTARKEELHMTPRFLRSHDGYTASIYTYAFREIPTFVPLFRAALQRCLSAAKQPPASAPRVNRT